MILVVRRQPHVLCFVANLFGMWNMLELFYSLGSKITKTNIHKPVSSWYRCELYYITASNFTGSKGRQGWAITVTSQWVPWGLASCLSNHLLKRISKKTPKLRVTGFCEGNPPVTGGFPSQKASNAEMFPLDDVIMATTVAVTKYSSRAGYPVQHACGEFLKISHQISWVFWFTFSYVANKKSLTRISEERWIATRNFTKNSSELVRGYSYLCLTILHESYSWTLHLSFLDILQALHHFFVILIYNSFKTCNFL